MTDDNKYVVNYDVSPSTSHEYEPRNLSLSASTTEFCVLLQFAPHARPTEIHDSLELIYM